MDSSCCVVDRRQWKRDMHCRMFEGHLEPQYCITLELDITNFLKKVKLRQYSFTFAFIYMVSKCANEIEEFRYRFLDGDVVLYDTIHTMFTYLDEETELFKCISVPMQDDLETYIEEANKTVRTQREYFTGPLGNDVFLFSALPWVSYTHISHTIAGEGENASPAFEWGKYFSRDGRTIMPFSVQIHHSFVDGIHIAKFVKKLQRALDRFE